MLIATLPAPHLTEKVEMVARHPLVDGFRFNVGHRTPFSPRETLERLMELAKEKIFWLDLKGRQLRILQWAVPTYGDIILNHEIEVDVPATIYFRGAEKSTVRAVNGNKIYVDPPPPKAVGAGQAINIHGTNLKIHGYLTDEDWEFMEAAKLLGIHRYMASFVQQSTDITCITDFDPEAEVDLKIECRLGLDFVRNIYPEFTETCRLVAAMDDLYTNLGADKMDIFEALQLIIDQDPQAIAASRIMTSLDQEEVVAMSDLTNLRFLELLGYSNFMIGDALCVYPDSFKKAMAALEQYFRYFKKGGDEDEVPTKEISLPYNWPWLRR